MGTKIDDTFFIDFRGHPRVNRSIDLDSLSQKIPLLTHVKSRHNPGDHFEVSARAPVNLFKPPFLTGWKIGLYDNFTD
jgi:hypothetical protein